MSFKISCSIFPFSYATRADSCFTQMMLLHITWTGFVISVLGFEITTTSNYIEAVRFLMHLLGWLGMLFLVCYHGQNLVDEVLNTRNYIINLKTRTVSQFFQSLAISDAIYSFYWYKKEVIVQKYVLLILLRSHKPLTLKACGMKVMSLATFLAVIEPPRPPL